MASQRVSCGRDFTSSPDINGTLNEAVKSGFDFACVPIVNPRYKREFVNGPAKNRCEALTRSDMLLTSEDWGSLIVAKMSPWLQTDSTNDIIRKNSTLAMKQELAFASHLSVPAILIPLKGPNCANLSRILNSFVLQGHNHQFWMRVPMIAPEDSLGDVFEREEEDINRQPKHDTWHWWNSLRLMCDCNKKISIALEVTENLPSSQAIDRWCGEPVKAAILPTSIFLTNKKGLPRLVSGSPAACETSFQAGCSDDNHRKLSPW
ncbi:Protein arginine N-methyltransferase 5 [Lamellibrachia satsuma]|nr:Protein arginine N-methyltransferase 5 [Lamellibrachia satsuma]